MTKLAVLCLLLLTGLQAAWALPLAERNMDSDESAALLVARAPKHPETDETYEEERRRERARQAEREEIRRIREAQEEAARRAAEQHAARRARMQEAAERARHGHGHDHDH